jgi:hypothetical protein
MGNSATHDSRGKFKPGNPGGPGRPRKPAEYVAITRELVTPAVWSRIVCAAIERAARGDSTARSWLSEYLIGRPPQSVHISSEATEYDAALAQYEQMTDDELRAIIAKVGEVGEVGADGASSGAGESGAGEAQP